jgi:hypothetical protein
MAGPSARLVNLHEDGLGWKPIQPLAVTLTATVGENRVGA